MTERQQLLVKNVDTNRQAILDAERWLWAHPQTGFTEWEAHAYLTEQFEALGYQLVQAGNIPGFYTDLDTGHPGPTLCIMAELDALEIPNHPEAVNGMAHSCGHHAQCAALLGTAAALRQSGALDGLSGRIRLMAVPAEELIQFSFREELRAKGVIHYTGGKAEFMYRGFFDGVDLALMAHAANTPDRDFACLAGHNGSLAKTIIYKGKAAHAAGSPHQGINAQYAAMLGLQACNNLRETFQERDFIRFHPVMEGAGCASNVIPSQLKIESKVRGRTVAAIRRENEKINRALAGAAVAMGAQVEIHDRPGYFPEALDPTFMKLVEQCCIDLVGEEKVRFNYNRISTASTDFGDLTTVIPGVQFLACGVEGTLHGTDYRVANPEQLCVNTSKAFLFVADALLSNGAAKAKEIIANYLPLYPSIQAYFEAVASFYLDKEAVLYGEDGRITVDLPHA